MKRSEKRPSVHTDDQDYLNTVAAELNHRPRRILGYRTPAEVFTELLTS